MKIKFSIVAILTTLYIQAQQEIKIDFLDAIAFKTIEISYERYVDDQSSIGISGFINFEKKNADFKYNEKRAITPFFRHYFTIEKTWNFFGEAFFNINSGEKERKITGGPNTYEDYTDGAIGIALGTKYTSKKGLTLDIYGGAGRNLFSNDSPDVVPRIGANIGWRF
jgi:hypothetical protein